MKYATLIVLAAVAVGCGKKDKFDVTPADVAKHDTKFGPGKMDFDHLPPGAKVQIIHKGDRLPDGSIADREGKIVTFDDKGPAPK